MGVLQKGLRASELAGEAGTNADLGRGVSEQVEEAAGAVHVGLGHARGFGNLTADSRAKTSRLGDTIGGLRARRRSLHGPRVLWMANAG